MYGLRNFKRIAIGIVRLKIPTRISKKEAPQDKELPSVVGFLVGTRLAGVGLPVGLVGMRLLTSVGLLVGRLLAGTLLAGRLFAVVGLGVDVQLLING